MRVFLGRLTASLLGAALLTLGPQTASSAPKTSRTAKLDTSSVQITFLGYQSLAGGRGLVFVEMTDSAVVEVTRSGQVVEYRLSGASVPLRNNKNPLLLRDFSSSALSAVLVPDKKAVRLVITLRSTVMPTHRLVNRGKGAVLEVELPAPPNG